jgi:ribulose-bisphosphate carboxylase small chain
VRLTQGTFSYLPDLTEREIEAQVRYALDQGWALSIEHSGDPHPRNVYWEMWGLPRFDLTEPGEVLSNLRACRSAHPDDYVRVSAYDARLGRQTTALSFIVNRPAQEPDLHLDRQEAPGRRLRYTLRSPDGSAPTSA